MADNILSRVRGYIWAEQLAQHIVEYPADWWQALKARWFPTWALRRWPVRKTRHKIDLKAIYPKLRLARPDEPYRVIVIDRKSEIPNPDLE